MVNVPEITIELVYAATPKQQYLTCLRVPRGCTVEEAIARSINDPNFRELYGKPLQVGIFSRLCSMTTVLQEGDRIEIYRPLRIDPKQARRKKVLR
jgi:putative ubiquitin-RnfH superfamily antitoxin RatB of RatAB toxin-antitoxin module